MASRIERDSLGEVRVPKEMYWGAQTARSLENFKIGHEKMPMPVIYALALIKKAAAIVHGDLGVLDEKKKQAILQAVDEILAGKWDTQFPLSIWQTGSGTQTNMNVNEVIANRAIELLGGERGSKQPIHPNDDVNKSQSSNDTFPSAMHIAIKKQIVDALLPSAKMFLHALQDKAKAFQNIIKVGRTHLMDAAPISLGQEFSGYGAQIEAAMHDIEQILPQISALALGGTAVGTGLNAPPQFGDRMAKVLSELTKMEFYSAPNKFAALGSNDAVVSLSGALRTLACSVFKITNDIRFLASGPRCGLSELYLPANEPGSSIMPGKVNPTQCEALTMVAVQVYGNDAAIAFAGSQGHLELNVFRPVMISNLLHSIELLSDGLRNFCEKCLVGIQPNQAHIQELLERSLMLATALNPVLGYDKATKIVQKAYAENLSLKEATVALGFLTAEEFDQHVDPRKMVLDLLHN